MAYDKGTSCSCPTDGIDRGLHRFTLASDPRPAGRNRHPRGSGRRRPLRGRPRPGAGGPGRGPDDGSPGARRRALRDPPSLGSHHSDFAAFRVASGAHGVGADGTAQADPQGASRRLAFPPLHVPAVPGRPGGDHAARRDVLLSPAGALAPQAAFLHGRYPPRYPPRGRAGGALPGHARRDDQVRGRGSLAVLRGLPRRGSLDLPPGLGRRARARQGVSGPGGPRLHRLPGHAGAPQERTESGAWLGEGRGRSPESAGPRAGRRQGVGRGHRPGPGLGSEASDGPAPRLPAAGGPARFPLGLRYLGLPLDRGGLRPAGPGGDELRRRDADDAPDFFAGGGRRRRRLLRYRPRFDCFRSHRAAG